MMGRCIVQDGLRLRVMLLNIHPPSLTTPMLRAVPLSSRLARQVSFLYDSMERPRSEGDMEIGNG